MNKITLSWKSKFLSTTHKLFIGSQQIGEMKDNNIDFSSTINYNGTKLKFRTKSLLRDKAEILDVDKKRIVATIRLSNFFNKASIYLNGSVYHWKVVNFFNPKWRIDGKNGVHIHFSGSYQNGSVQSNVPEDLLLLTGLLINNYYYRFTMLIILSQMPVWVILFSVLFKS